MKDSYKKMLSPIYLGGKKEPYLLLIVLVLSINVGLMCPEVWLEYFIYGLLTIGSIKSPDIIYYLFLQKESLEKYDHWIEYMKGQEYKSILSIGTIVCWFFYLSTLILLYKSIISIEFIDGDGDGVNTILFIINITFILINILSIRDYFKTMIKIF